jgi:hypothetical protein
VEFLLAKNPAFSVSHRLHTQRRKISKNSGFSVKAKEALIYSIENKPAPL